MLISAFHTTFETFLLLQIDHNIQNDFNSDDKKNIANNFSKFTTLAASRIYFQNCYTLH